MALAPARGSAHSAGVTTLRVQPADERLVGSLPCAPDAATATLALAVLALDAGGGRSRLHGRGLPALSVVPALAALGVEVMQQRDGCEVTGKGLQLGEPGATLSVAGPAAAAALGAVLAGQRFGSELRVEPGGWRTDASVALGSIVAPLRARGALVEGQLVAHRPDLVLSPLRFQPAPMEALSPLQHQPSPYDWPGKAAALISGLLSDGTTLIQESVVSHERCERLLSALGLPIASAGPFVQLDGGAWDGRIDAVDSALPGSSATAAALLGAAALVPDSLVTVRNVACSAGTRGYLDALRAASATLALTPRETLLGEATADVTLRGQGSAGLVLQGELACRAGAPAGLLSVLAVAARRGVESRLALRQDAGALQELLGSFGIETAVQGDTLCIEGCHGRRLSACRYDAAGEGVHAMAATLLALVADGPCEIARAGAIVDCFPRFVGSLRALGARIEVCS